MTWRELPTKVGSCIVLLIILITSCGVLGAAAQDDSVAAAERTLAWQWTGGAEGGWVQCVATTPTGTILAGTENGGLFRSVDGGASWSPSEEGLSWPCCNYIIASLAVSGSAIYAGTWAAASIVPSMTR